MINRIDIDYLDDTINGSTKRGVMWLYYSYSKLEAIFESLEVNI